MSRQKNACEWKMKTNSAFVSDCAECWVELWKRNRSSSWLMSCQFSNELLLCTGGRQQKLLFMMMLLMWRKKEQYENLLSNYYVEFTVAWITGDCISYGNYKVEAYLFFPRVTLLTPNITDNISPSTSHSHQSLFKFMPCQKLIYDKHLRHEFVYIDITLLLPSI